MEELFKTTMDRLNTELTIAVKEKTELKSRLQDVEKKFEVLETGHESLRSEHEAAVSEREGLKRELASVKKGKAFLDKRLKEMESDMFVAGLLKEKVSLEIEMGRLKNEIGPRDQEITRLKAESIDKDLRLAALQEEKNSIEQKLKDSEQVAQVLSRDFLREKDLNKDDKIASEKFAMENSALKAKISEFEDIAKEYNILLSEREDMRAKLAALETDVDYKNQQEIRAEAYHSPEEVELPPIVLNTRAQK